MTATHTFTSGLAPCSRATRRRRAPTATRSTARRSRAMRTGASSAPCAGTERLRAHRCIRFTSVLPAHAGSCSLESDYTASLHLAPVGPLELAMSSRLFAPIALGDIELPNRIVVAPMCQYSADDGSATDWHLQHLSQLAYSGAGHIVVATVGAGAFRPVVSGLVSPFLPTWREAFWTSL